MTTDEKKELADALVEAMNREELHTGEAAKALNVKACYVSMIKNPDLWGSIPAKAWDRVEEWMQTRGKIRDFVIPEGEEIVTQKAYTPRTSMPELTPREEKAFREAMGPEEHSPEAVEEGKIASSQAPRNDGGRKGTPKKEKNGRSVVLTLYKEELADLRQKVASLEEEKKVYFESCQALSERLAETEKKLFILEDETISVLLARMDCTENALREKKRAGKIVWPGFARVVIFQRINYGKS
jgi:hypothetical protein